MKGIHYNDNLSDHDKVSSNNTRFYQNKIAENLENLINGSTVESSFNFYKQNKKCSFEKLNLEAINERIDATISPKQKLLNKENSEIYSSSIAENQPTQIKPLNKEENPLKKSILKKMGRFDQINNNNLDTVRKQKSKSVKIINKQVIIINENENEIYDLLTPVQDQNGN